MKIGFAFLTYRGIHNQQVYKKLFDELSADGHEVISAVHSKKRFESTILPDLDFISTIETRWATPSLIEAQILLFSHLFSQGSDIVYFLSGDCLPLRRSKGFISLNQETTFCLQDKEFLGGHNEDYQYDQSKVFSGVNQNKWNNDIFRVNSLDIDFKNFEKQQMFFCINKRDFNTVFQKTLENNYFNKLQRLSPMDEYFWVNIFNLLDIPYRAMDSYLYSNRRNNVNTQAEDFRLCVINDDIKDKYIFLRKLRQENAEINFI